MINADRSLAVQVNIFVRYKIMQMVESQNLSMVRSTLARLRRGVGSKPGSRPEIWDITLRDIPEALVGRWDPSDVSGLTYGTDIVCSSSTG